ncbi:cation diffusion facilitator CzcD-associated flavoprotein CzcO [Microterricola gilva]|uniref:Cation diffusion facilitator CzcD-associated flavoprotein CzcO n=1 Tax=Microterricola gilva TaxID=393267 RepID=A0A4Q8AK93_9MICO|nr:FAD-dependent oxidoreductase [Microterricola gilva]RZU64285.1 cation diffusion facilitator CzcD-associated flavoprotein CzcO [Microterricola gilva]
MSVAGAAADRARLPIVVIGAGPVGLAAAAHLIERGESFVLLEAGATVAAAVREWAHVRLFSPWSIVTDSAAVRLLEATGWPAPDAAALPFGHELVSDYLEPLAALPAIAAALRLNTEVLAVTRDGADKTRSRRRDRSPFVLRVRDADGVVEELAARAVIDASGTWRTPNPIGAGGLPPLGSEADGVSALLETAMPDVLGPARARFAGRSVAVVGSGHSATNTLLALATLARDEPETRLHWVIRGASAARSYGSDADELPARGAIGSRLRRLVESGAITLHERFGITALEELDGALRVHGRRAGEPVTLDVDRLVAATGFRPDLGVLRELRIELDDIVEAPRALAPLIDPNLHSCGSVPAHGEAELRHPEGDVYIVGMKSYGRAPTFLLATGYEQVRSVVARLAGDHESARLVQLVLPETGVCNTDDAGDAGGDACCADPAPVRVELSLSRP